MYSISEGSLALQLGLEEKREQIRVQISSEVCSTETIVKYLASIEGPLDIYCWYEGAFNLPKVGADFMKQRVFEPLYRLKNETKLGLYSLSAWNFKKNIAEMPASTAIGEAINRINKAAIECLYSSSFFKYCAQVEQGSGLYNFIAEELPKKQWLFNLSQGQKKSGRSLSDFFNKQPSVFDCIKEKDVSAAYSAMQYVEGYYLIQESVKRAISNGQKKVEIAFVLPNDEGKYYLDFPIDLEKMLRSDFGNKLSGMDINIRFQFFKYGETLNSRPYIDRRRDAPLVTPKEIGSYFDYLSPQFPSTQNGKVFFLRDAIHNLNGSTGYEK